MLKNRLSRLLKLSLEMVKRPVVWSSVAPVAFTYASKALVAMRIKVVPVSTMPAVVSRIVVFEDPYVIDWSMPQNSLAGEVVVSGLRMKISTIL